MENLPQSIQQKLGEGEWGWDDLPTTRDDASSWRDVETGCVLTKQELSRVKNARCPAQAGREGQTDDRVLALERDVAKLSVEVANSRDPRLFFFSGVVKSRRGQHSIASAFHNKTYEKCVFCGSENGLTLAHLITEIDTTDESAKDISFDVYGPPTYEDNLDTKSPRNFLRLCGTKGVKGSCHDLFDSFRLSLIYDPLQQNYEIFSVDSSHFLHKKRIKLSIECPPYRRLLCWRLKKTLSLFGSLLGTDAPAINDVADFSDTTSAVRSVDNEMSSSMSFVALSGDGKPKTSSVKKTNNKKSRESRVRCFKCNARGHLKKDCPNRRILQEKAHTNK